MSRYATGLLVFSVFLLIFGFLSGKINLSSFEYISLPGLLYAVLKSLIVVLVLLLSLAAALPLLIIDVVLLFFTNFDFSLISHLWAVSWKGVTLGWFWTETSGSSIFFGSIILLIISSAFSRRRRV
jgi:hypothetical protein